MVGSESVALESEDAIWGVCLGAVFDLGVCEHSIVAEVVMSAKRHCGE